MRIVGIVCILLSVNFIATSAITALANCAAAARRCSRCGSLIVSVMLDVVGGVGRGRLGRFSRVIIGGGGVWSGRPAAPLQFA